MSQAERARRFRERHPERVRASSRRYREQTRAPCHECGSEIVGQPRVHFCSEECRKDARRTSEHGSRRRAFVAFSNYKQDEGCTRCGYNKCAGALHFHHRDPDLKEMRMTALHFCSGSEAVMAELAKCDLLCANCHAEAHEAMRQVTP